MNKKNIIFGVLVIGAILLMANYQSIFKSVVPPIPEIVSSKADGTSSTLFNYSTKVVGEVINKGGDGYIVVKAYVTQAGRTFEKTEKIYLSSYQTEKFEFIFDEVKLFKKQPTYNVETFALGSLAR